MRQTRMKQKIKYEKTKVQPYYIDWFWCQIFGWEIENNSIISTMKMILEFKYYNNSGSYYPWMRRYLILLLNILSDGAFWTPYWRLSREWMQNYYVHVRLVISGIGSQLWNSFFPAASIHPLYQYSFLWAPSNDTQSPRLTWTQGDKVCSTWLHPAKYVVLTPIYFFWILNWISECHNVTLKLIDRHQIMIKLLIAHNVYCFFFIWRRHTSHFCASRTFIEWIANRIAASRPTIQRTTTTDSCQSDRTTCSISFIRLGLGFLTTHDKSYVYFHQLCNFVWSEIFYIFIWSVSS